MSIYIDSNSRLHHEQGSAFALNCPHCQVFAHMTPLSVPQFVPLVTHRPAQVGVVFRCDACNAPVFLKFPVKIYAGNRVELNPHYSELERPREKFSMLYLPEQCESLFREALACYSAGYFNAFASLCRRTAHSMFANIGDNSRLKIFDLLSEIREMAELDSESFALIKKIVFDNDTEHTGFPILTAHSAGLLLEVMKDLLYQCYVRRGKLRQAVKVRHFFAAERNADNVTQMKAAT
jgi:hypothetical protein